MRLRKVISKKDFRQFKDFRNKLYHNDPYYVSTAEFTCDMILFQNTSFTKNCFVEPIIIEEDDILAEAILVQAPNDDFLQIAFFEALMNCKSAVEMLLAYAKEVAKKRGLPQIIVGLNAHLSYGVGLTVNMNEPNTFDSTYTKPYYIDYFNDASNSYLLVAFKAQLAKIVSNVKAREMAITIKPLNFKDFDNEMERFREICNKTIGTTFLYSKTEPHHFEELLSSMRFFLKKENILFAYDHDKIVGFVFWHPDYNEILDKGKKNSLIKIAYRYLRYGNKIKKVKLNSIGVLPEYQGGVTMLLLNEVKEMIKAKYEEIETNFVWYDNQKSRRLNEHLIGEVNREFKVFSYEVNND